MREIKFRAWKDHKMIESFLLEDCNILNPSDMIAPYAIKLMQFTGLTDKNGKEIYEGDIVRIMRQGTAFIGEVKWGSAGFFIYTEQLPNLFEFSEIHDEVIGNIYEK